MSKPNEGPDVISVRIPSRLELLSVLDHVADRLLGATAGNIMAAIALISLSASISAMTFAGPRVYFAMARDGLFFRRAATVHGRFRTPANSIIAQALWSSLLVLSAQAQSLINYTGFAIWLFSGVAVAALFVLRVCKRTGRRHLRTPIGQLDSTPPCSHRLIVKRQKGRPCFRCLQHGKRITSAIHSKPQSGLSD